MTQLALIYARAANGVIGRDNALPWHLPEDLAHFRALTQGHPVLMGRRTWESLPPRFRPLPGRRNIVLTRQAGWQAEGAEAAPDLRGAVTRCAGAPLAWVIGGAALYAAALPFASRVEATEIARDFAGDARLAPLGPEWREVARSAHVAASGLPYAFVRYERQGPALAF